MNTPKNDREAVSAILNGMESAGWTVDSVDDGEQHFSVSSTKRAIDAVMDVDMAHVFLSKGDVSGWVWFVLGNDPEEVAANSTVNLDPDLSSITGPWWE